MDPKQSYQTKGSGGGFFHYNPFQGATLLCYPKDRPKELPRVYILRPDRPPRGGAPNTYKAYAEGTNKRLWVEMEVTMIPRGEDEQGVLQYEPYVGRTPRCYLDGRPVLRFSIKYPRSKRGKKSWGSF